MIDDAARRSHDDLPEDFDTAFARALELVAGAGAVTVLSGAGISTDSGIPDFRGPDGVWTVDPDAEMMSNIERYLTDPEVRRRAWQHRASSQLWDASPNDGHDAVVALERQGRLRAVVTQNIDGLHQAAGSSPELVVEVHGSVRDVVCTACDYRAPIAVALDRVLAGEEDPPCPDCGGILKSSTVLFGEQLPADAMSRALAAVAVSDLLIAVGTTLGVYPVNQLVPTAAQHGVPVLILNGSPTEMDELAEVVVRGDISALLTALVG